MAQSEQDQYGEQKKSEAEQVLQESQRLALVEVNDTYVPPSVEEKPSVVESRTGLKWYHWAGIAAATVIVLPIGVKLIMSAMDRRSK